MNYKSLTTYCLYAGLLLASSNVFSQEGNITVNQDPGITELIKLKKEVNSEDEDSNRYKIQIYSGSRQQAESVETNFKGVFNKWSSKMVYETPNYKIWIGNFRSRLEAERALIKIKKEFNSAFIFKPKKKAKR